MYNDYLKYLNLESLNIPAAILDQATLLDKAVVSELLDSSNALLKVIDYAQCAQEPSVSDLAKGFETDSTSINISYEDDNAWEYDTDYSEDSAEEEFYDDYEYDDDLSLTDSTASAYIDEDLEDDAYDYDDADLNISVDTEYGMGEDYSNAIDTNYSFEFAEATSQNTLYDDDELYEDSDFDVLDISLGNDAPNELVEEEMYEEDDDMLDDLDIFNVDESILDNTDTKITLEDFMGADSGYDFDDALNAAAEEENKTEAFDPYSQYDSFVDGVPQPTMFKSGENPFEKYDQQVVDITNKVGAFLNKVNPTPSIKEKIKQEQEKGDLANVK